MSEAEGPQKFKRLKSSRACDQCRRLRTRCEEGPALSASHHGPLDPINPRDRKCRRCTRLNIDCTFILPIAETRDRKHAASSPQDSQTDGSIVSPTSTSRPNIPRKQSSTSSPSSILEPMEQFKSFLDSSMPIINSKEVSNNASVLLYCCVRLLVASFTEPSNTLMKDQIQQSIQRYFLDKQPITTPSPHNVQSLLLLSLFVDEPGAGNKLVSAVRMASSLYWNRPPDQPDEDRSPVIKFMWWTLVSQDIWLYLYSGTPPLITYMGFNVAKIGSPSFFSALVGISEVLRMLIRRESIAEYAEHETALDSLIAWEQRHFASVYPPNSPPNRGTSLDAYAFLRILHSVVLSLFVLQDTYFHDIYLARRQQANMMTSETEENFSAGYVPQQNLMQSQGYEQNYLSTGSSYFVYPNNYILNMLLGTLRLHMIHPVLFARWGYLQRFSEIVVLAILRLPMQTEDAGSRSNVPFGFSVQQNHIFDERHQVIQSWRSICIIKEDRWSKLVAIAEQGIGWQMVLDLNDPFEEQEEETDSGEGDSGSGKN